MSRAALRGGTGDASCFEAVCRGVWILERVGSESAITLGVLDFLETLVPFHFTGDSCNSMWEAGGGTAVIGVFHEYARTVATGIIEGC